MWYKACSDGISSQRLWVHAWSLHNLYPTFIYLCCILRDWVHGFWGYIVATFGFKKMFTVVMCSPTLHVYFWHHFRSCPQRVRSPTLYHYNNLDMRTNISWFLSATMQLIQLFIHGNNRYLFPKRWNWQICHTHQAFKLPLHTYSGQLRSNISHCESNPTVYSSSLWKKVLVSYFQKKIS